MARRFASVVELIEASKIDHRVLAAHDDLDEEALWLFVTRQVGPCRVADALELAGPLHDFVADLGKRRRISLTELQHAPVERLVAGGLALERRRAALDRDRLIIQVSQVPAPKAPGGGRWPHRAALAKNEGKSPEEVEDLARSRIIDQLVHDLVAMKAPVVQALGAEAGNLARLRLVAAGRRAATLRRRLGEWRRLVAWTRPGGQLMSYPHLAEVVGYLEARAGEPCGRTVPRSAAQALHFMEEAGQRPREERVAGDEALEATVKELTVQLDKLGGERRQAQYLFIRIIVAFEDTVLDEARPAYVRYYAWLRLAKYWAAFRFDDVRWVNVDHVALEADGMGFHLERTKVSGPGKRAGTLYAYILKEAYYRHREWLQVGWRLRGEAFPGSPYLFPIPTKDLAGAKAIAGDYSDAAAASQALFSCLQVGADEDARPLLPPLGGLYWTEHSERNAMPTAAAALGLGEVAINRLGRWQTGKVTDVYIRSTVRIVAQAQKAIAARVRAGGSDFLGESAALERYAQYLRGKGHAEDAVRRVVQDLTHFDGHSDTEEVASDPEGAPGAETPVAGASEEEKDDELRDREPEAENQGGLTGYVVSIVGRKAYRRLHHLGRCPMLPGTDYHNYRLYGSEAPPPDAYDSVCARCWPSRAAAVPVSAASSASSSGEIED